MATDEQWRLVEWDQLANSACVVELRDRVEALEAAQNLRQQDEDVERVAEPIATDAELLKVWDDRKGSDLLVRMSAIYDLGRQHGAAANSKPTPNFPQIRSSAPTVGLKEMLARVRNEGSSLRGYAATDVIEAVADWLEQQQEVPIGRSTASADYFAAMLRSEASR